MAHILAGPMKFLSRPDWEEEYACFLDSHLAPACEELGIEIEDIGDFLDNAAFATIFGCVFEDFLTWETGDGRNLAGDYLKRRGYRESASTKTYLKALRVSVMSLYEVSQVERDKGFLARDLIRGGEPAWISERKGTHSLKQWDRIAARIVKIGSEYQMSGGILPFRHDDAGAALEMFNDILKAGPEPMKAVLEDAGIEIDSASLADASSLEGFMRVASRLFITEWLINTVGRIIDAPRPTLQNTDREFIVFCTTSFEPVAGTRLDVLNDAVLAIPGIERDGENVFAWLKPDTRAVAMAGGRKNAGAADEELQGQTSLGRITVSRSLVALETNSRERAERGGALLTAALADLVGEPAVSTRTVDEMMAQQSPLTDDAPASAFSPDDEHTIIHAHMEQHYRRLLDEPVPALGDQTPRQAAGTPEGRENVVAWLKYIENATAKHHRRDDPMASYDMKWLWRELGVEARRV